MNAHAESDSGGFADLEKRDGRTVICPRCGRQPVGGHVHIIARRKVGPGGVSTKQVASSQLSMCEKCCVQVFTLLESGLHDLIDFPASRAGRTPEGRVR